LNRSIPTPTTSVLEIGPFTIHFYALCIIAGIVIAVWLGDKRFKAHGDNLENVVADVAIWAVPFGIIGGRLYHVISSPNNYFGKNGEPIDAFKIWQGGLGIWGAISVGAIAAYFAYKKQQKKKDLPSFGYFLDALAPGILLAQAIGRLGNWFNGELFGRPTDLPWALEIPQSLRPDGYTAFETFHPAFLYELIWCTLIATALILVKKKLAPGQVFSAYVALYSVGRLLIEVIRIDQANTIAGVRVNVWVSAIVATLAVLNYLRLGRSSAKI
jgi:prolipoprotein diacylglyceryl transferase